ncbi:alpha/beta hydrolase [Pedobacter terrae]|uniref:alpha/beta hydrolase n=1 Tax=Pedobacter terrae TaxID=405671 RepID=UPI002FF6A232
MKCILLVSISLAVSSLSFCQTKIKKVFFSKVLNDSIHCNIWLPKNWNANGRYPSVYLNAYGALGGGNGMLVAANINNFVNNLPPSVVIDITSGQMDKMDYNYETGETGKTGKSFIECLKTELIPHIETDYKTTNFRAFIGQSYSSSYANYLFLKQPGLFNAYILFTPEKITKEQPPFEISDELIAYYKAHPTFYYLAPAGKDIERRKDYANEIKQKITVLDSANFHFKYELFPDAGHNDIVSYGLLNGLKFVYSSYSIAIPKNVNDITKWFDDTKNKVKEIYGLEYIKNSNLQVSLINAIAEQKDKKAMDYFAGYFNDTTAKDNSLMLFNTAYTYQTDFTDVEKAKEYYLKSINEAKRKNNRNASDNAYRSLAKNLYWQHDKNKEAAWRTLKEGFEYTKYYAYKYIAGKISVESKSNLDEGIANLLDFIKYRGTNPPDTFYTVSDAYLLIAKCYYYKNNKYNAKLYLNKSLNENSKNESAKRWKTEVKM